MPEELACDHRTRERAISHGAAVLLALGSAAGSGIKTPRFPSILTYCSIAHKNIVEFLDIGIIRPIFPKVTGSKDHSRAPAAHDRHDTNTDVAPSLTSLRASQPQTSTIQTSARFSGENISDTQEQGTRSRFSYFATQNPFSDGRNDNSLVTNNSNGSEIMSPEDHASETHNSESENRATSVLPSTHSMESTSSDSAKAIDSFFAQSSEDVNFRNLA